MAMVNKFADRNDNVMVISFDEETLVDNLKPDVYEAVEHPMMGIYFVRKSHYLKTPEKLYGSASSRAEKVLNSYDNTDKSFGVLLTGAKGAGKTMLCSHIANLAVDRGLPVILIEERMNIRALSDVLAKVGECVLLFDEFGKKYKDEDDAQDGFLGFLDGTGSAKRLILLTENSKHDINEYLLDRPGRVYYHFEYNKIEEAVVIEYCEERGVDKDNIDKLVTFLDRSRRFSFDTLMAIVKEYKLYGGDVEELIKDLNVDVVTQPLVCKEEIVESVVDINTGKYLKFSQILKDPGRVLISIDSDSVENKGNNNKKPKTKNDNLIPELYEHSDIKLHLEKGSLVSKIEDNRSYRHTVRGMVLQVNTVEKEVSTVYGAF